MAVFQLWYYYARNLEGVSTDLDVNIAMAADMLFPGLKDVPRDVQLARGAKMLRYEEARSSSRLSCPSAPA
jgi:hypothetical protein